MCVSDSEEQDRQLSDLMFSTLAPVPAELYEDQKKVGFEITQTQQTLDRLGRRVGS